VVRCLARRWHAFVFAACVLAGTLGEAAPCLARNLDGFLKTVRETRVYHGLHVLRMNRVAVEIWRRYRREFPGVTLALLVDYMSRHDSEKLDDTQEFRKKYWSEVKTGPSFAARLRRIVLLNARFERPLDQWPEADRTWAQRTIAELNAVGERWSMEFFEQRGLLVDGKPGPVAMLLKMIERIADVVDRNSDRGTLREFGNKEQPPLSRFLSGRSLEIGLRIQKMFYAKLVEGLEYEGPHAGLNTCTAQRLMLGLGLR
jgi:hypothetical protein